MSNPKTPQIATPDVEEKLKSKMTDIARKSKEMEAKAVAQETGYPYINLVGFAIKPEALSLIEQETAKAFEMVAFYEHEREVRIGAVNPDLQAVHDVIEQLRQKNNVNVTLYQISKHSFDVAFRIYDVLPKIRETVAGVKITEQDFERFTKEIGNFQDLERMVRDVSITNMVTLIIAAAVKSRASDIHIEAEEKGIKIRFRIDGLLHDAAVIGKEVWPKVIARIKLLAKLKINITTRPQDGRFTIFLSDDKIDVRVSALPTSYGESVVMRLLMSSSIRITFENLGIRGKAFADLQSEMQKPNGMIITTGPTGSGKTTTLYAILNLLNDKGSKIITIEDPIEYRIEGVNQSQTDEAKGYTFANGLRSLLRQDPDVLMVGEIRDLETADLAINASLTGHLVLSTLHTNDAFGTVPRFLGMNVKPFLLSPALNAMIGQRLVRRICESCKRPESFDAETSKRIQKIMKTLPKDSGYAFDFSKAQFARGGGCDKCQGLGYWGRIGIFEIMTMNKAVENLILSGHVSEYDMLKVALQHGTITMIQDGLLKAAEGITTVEEVFRVAKDTSGIYGE